MEYDFWEKIKKESKARSFDSFELSDIFSEMTKMFVVNECAIIANRILALNRLLSTKNDIVLASICSSLLVDKSKNFDEVFCKLEELKLDIKTQLIMLDKINNNNDNFRDNKHLIGERRIGVCKHTNEIVEQEYNGVTNDSNDEFGWSCLHKK